MTAVRPAWFILLMIFWLSCTNQKTGTPLKDIFYANSTEGKAVVVYSDFRTIYYPSIEAFVSGDTSCNLEYPSEVGQNVFASLYPYFGIQAQSLPFGVWPDTRSLERHAYLGGASIGMTSLFLWRDHSSGDIMGDLIDANQHIEVGFNKLLSFNILNSTTLPEENRLYWNYAGGDNSVDADCSMVYYFNDHTFIIYNYPRDVLIILSWSPKPQYNNSASNNEGIGVREITVEYYRLEQILNYQGKKIRGNFEIACIAMCCTNEQLYIGLRKLNDDSNSVHVVVCQLPEVNGVDLKASQIVVFDNVNIGSVGKLHVNLLVDENTVLLTTANKYYWFDRGADMS
jgi:hypothetical protein